MARLSPGRSVLLPALALGALAALAKNLPQLVRYLRIKRM
jgi:hypothetical protein